MTTSGPVRRLQVLSFANQCYCLLIINMVALGREHGDSKCCTLKTSLSTQIRSKRWRHVTTPKEDATNFAFLLRNKQNKTNKKPTTNQSFFCYDHHFQVFSESHGVTQVIQRAGMPVTELPSLEQNLKKKKSSTSSYPKCKTFKGRKSGSRDPFSLFL